MPTLISGTVRDRRGQPIEGARVAFVSGPVDLPDIAAVTGGDGRFTFAAPAPGPYRLACIADGYERAEVAARVAAAPVDLDVRLRKG
jgi:protocatechuate 3,4-dioxygenase beta subunit